MSNSVTLTGYLGRDCELRTTAERTVTRTRWNPIAEMDDPVEVTLPSRTYAVLSLATHHYLDGHRQTRWHRLIAWHADRMDRRALRIAGKGWQVRVTGREETFTLTADDGTQREIRQIVVEEFRILRVKPRREHP